MHCTVLTYPNPNLCAANGDSVANTVDPHSGAHSKPYYDDSDPPELFLDSGSDSSSDDDDDLAATGVWADTHPEGVTVRLTLINKIIRILLIDVR